MPSIISNEERNCIPFHSNWYESELVFLHAYLNYSHLMLQMFKIIHKYEDLSALILNLISYETIRR